MSKTPKGSPTLASNEFIRQSFVGKVQLFDCSRLYACMVPCMNYSFTKIQSIIKILNMNFNIWSLEPSKV